MTNNPLRYTDPTGLFNTCTNCDQLGAAFCVVDMSLPGCQELNENLHRYGCGLREGAGLECASEVPRPPPRPPALQYPQNYGQIETYEDVIALERSQARWRDIMLPDRTSPLERIEPATVVRFATGNIARACTFGLVRRVACKGIARIAAEFAFPDPVIAPTLPPHIPGQNGPRSPWSTPAP